MAAAITLQLGQCGTQVGHQLLSALHDEAISSDPPHHGPDDETLGMFFNETSKGKPEARAVIIDMEPKAVNCAVQSTARLQWAYAESQQFVQKSGSGNNWAYGYKVHAPRCENKILNLIRKEAEKCDHLGGFVLLMSLAGGTGSGFGSYVGGMLRDNFPRALVLNPVICPYTSGEVAVQNYNAVLSLSHMCVANDASVLLHNNQLHDICQKLLGVKQVSFADMNRVAAHQLACALVPVTQSSVARTRNSLHNIVASLACNSQYKMLDLKCVPYVAPGSVAFSAFNWSGLTKRIYQMMLTDFHMDEGLNWHTKLSHSTVKTKYISSMLFLRGQGANAETDFDLFKDPRLYPAWMPPRDRCSIWRTNRTFQKNEKCMALLSNGTSCVRPLDNLTEKAWDMFGSRAYLHHYLKYGLEEDDFVNAFATVENVIHSYKTIA